MWGDKFKRSELDSWRGDVNGCDSRFVVKGTCGDHPVVMFISGALVGKRAVLHGDTGEVLQLEGAEVRS